MGLAQQKSAMLAPQLNLILHITPAYKYTQWLPIPSVSIMLSVNTLKTFQSHDWDNGTNGGCQLGSGDLRLLPLLCGLLIRYGPMGAYWHHGCSKEWQGCPKW